MGTSIDIETLYNILHKYSKQSEFHLVLETGNEGLTKKIEKIGINRPGLTLTGNFDYFVQERIQVFGRGESSYLQSLDKEALTETVDTFFQFDIPCCFFTHDARIDPVLISEAKKKQVPIFRVSSSTSVFVNVLSQVLDDALAPRVSIHGVLLEVYGTGILITGKSGVGKSECALELIERGHRLIVDDTVELRNMRLSTVTGMNTEHLKYYMEIRGLGIINIRDLFGIGSVMDSKEVDVVVNLEEWDSEKEYDRLGLDDVSVEILGIKLPLIVLPVRPGRNIPVLIEIAAMNARMKKMGYHPAREYNEKLKEWIKVRQVEHQKET
jgi:HPr kinase/phosphorylase